MQSSLSRVALLVAVIVVGLLVLRPEVQNFLVSTTAGPRPVEARGALTATESVAIQIFEANSGSVVQVVSQMDAGDFNARMTGAGGAATGSGFVWDDIGHIVTNNHVVEGSRKVTVRLATGEVASAEITGLAPSYDLAVLKIASRGTLPTPLPLGSSADLKVGQAAFAIGNPFGLEGSMSAGIVSALKRHLPTSEGRDIAGAIQTDASINPGNSGGPLLDSSGRLIGVTTAILSPSGTSAGVGLAIPVDVVNRIVPQLIRSGRVPVPGIGASIADESVAAQADVQDGLVVVDVRPGSPAQKAGLKGVDQWSGAIGDVILAVDGMPVHLYADLTDVLEQVGVGKQVTLTIVNNGAKREAKVAVVDIGGSSG